MTLPCRSFERRRGSRPSSGGFRRARLFFLRRRGTIAARKQGGTDMEKQPQLHTIAPVYDENSRILILGSFPSVKSRESAFFYGHPQNRFWRVVSTVLGCECPRTVEEKQQMLHTHHIALWDILSRLLNRFGAFDSEFFNIFHIIVRTDNN